MSERRPTVVFFPEGAYGPTNNCVGIADVLAERGIRAVFVVEESFAGTLEARGFEEALMRLSPPPEVPEEPGQFWKDFIRDTAPEFRKPTIEQLSTFLLPTWTALVDGARFVNRRLEAIFDELQPDAIVQDNVVCFPAVAASGGPWVRIVSCNPLELKDPALPPLFSGYPTGDPTGWQEFREEYRRTHSDLWGDFAAFVEANGSPPLTELEFMNESPYLNLFLYPEEADYDRSLPLGPTWHRLESCSRRPESVFEMPAALGASGALVYFSLGSLGSADVGLMHRLIGILAETPHRYVVSKGPQAEQIELADNMWGEEFLPQPAIMPLVDLVDHPRREQHRDRGPASREADGRAAAVLGPIRQRTADGGAGVRPPARSVDLRAGGADWQRSSDCSPRTMLGNGWQVQPPGSSRVRGSAGPPT